MIRPTPTLAALLLDYLRKRGGVAMTAFIITLVVILVYEFLVFAVSRNRVAVIEAKPESIVVLFRWLLRLSFGLSIALLTLLFAIWGTVMYDQSDPYTSGLLWR